MQWQNLVYIKPVSDRSQKPHPTIPCELFLILESIGVTTEVNENKWNGFTFEMECVNHHVIYTGILNSNFLPPVPNVFTPCPHFFYPPTRRSLWWVWIFGITYVVAFGKIHITCAKPCSEGVKIFRRGKNISKEMKTFEIGKTISIWEIMK